LCDANATYPHQSGVAWKEGLGAGKGWQAAAGLKCTADPLPAMLVLLHEQARAMAEALGDRAGVAAACGDLGNCYYSTGDYVRAREMHEQEKAICEELGRRAGVAVACGNLGNCYYRTGDYGQAREMHEQHRAMAEALGDRAGVAAAGVNLGNCMSSTGEYMEAISYFKTQYTIAVELQLQEIQAKAALGMGVAMRLYVRAGRQAAAASLVPSPAAGASRDAFMAAADREDLSSDFSDEGQEEADVRRTPGPRSTASAIMEDEVKEAVTWLKTALAAGKRVASLHLAHLAYDAGQEDRAVDHLKDYLSWHGAWGRRWCDGCGQKRGELLTCGGCRVVRFCSVDHQKMASNGWRGGSLLTGRHKDICELLGRWRGAEKDGASPDSLRADLLEFLRQLSLRSNESEGAPPLLPPASLGAAAGRVFRRGRADDAVDILIARFNKVCWRAYLWARSAARRDCRAPTPGALPPCMPRWGAAARLCLTVLNRTRDGARCWTPRTFQRPPMSSMPCLRSRFRTWTAHRPSPRSGYARPARVPVSRLLVPCPVRPHVL